MNPNCETPTSGACDERFLACPVLVYGPRKAGTTLLQNLLDGGPAVLMMPEELKIKYMAKLGWPWEKPAARWFLERGRSYFPNLFRIMPDGQTLQMNGPGVFGDLTLEQVEQILDLEKYASGLEALLTENASDPAELMRRDVRSFAGALKSGLGTKVRWGSKEVGGVPALVTAFFQRCFPEGRIVYLVRQPEFIVRSIILDRRRKGKRMSMRRLLHECRDAQNMVNFGYEHALQDGVVVSYEQLTENPVGVINRVCEKLGLPVDPIHAIPTALGCPVVVATSSRPTTRVFLQEADWKKDLTAREVLAIRLFCLCAPLYYRLGGRRMVDYDSLRSLPAR